VTLRPVILRVPQTAGESPPQRVQRQRETARAALAKCAELVGAPAAGWTLDDRGAPLPSAGYTWSISHKKDWAVAVIAREPVGIDVERIEDRRDHLLEAVASAEEWTLAGERRWPTFFRIWTAKEAVLKSRGMGIGELDDCRILHAPRGEPWKLRFADGHAFVQHFEFDQHVAAVATPAVMKIDWTVIAEPNRAREYAVTPVDPNPERRRRSVPTRAAHESRE